MAFPIKCRAEWHDLVQAVEDAAENVSGGDVSENSIRKLENAARMAREALQEWKAGAKERT